MARKPLPPLPADIEQLRHRVELWRRKRSRRCRIPEDLWDAAVALAGTHGLYRVARSLRLGYDSLKLQTATRSRAHPSFKGSPAFVELQPSPPLSLTPWTGPVIELANTDGDRLAIRMPGNNELDVVSLAAVFLRRQP